MKIILIAMLTFLTVSFLYAFIFGKPSFLANILLQNRIIPLSHPVLDLRGYQDDNYLYYTGWLASKVAGKPLTQNGNPLPWLTYPFISFIEDRLSKNFKIFEYGAGLSTLWFAEKVGTIVSVEHDQAWFKEVSSMAPPNAEIIFIDNFSESKYADSIEHEYSPFHIVLVDGVHRISCARKALNHLTDDGVIIWDDTNQPKYEEGFELLASNGFRRIDFEGMFPINKHPEKTSVFYKQNNCLGI